MLILFFGPDGWQPYCRVTIPVSLRRPWQIIEFLSIKFGVKLEST